MKLAEKRFGKLNEADKHLFVAVAAGIRADYTEGEDNDKIEDANNWEERRIIKADRIEWLCRDKQAKELVTNSGIQVTGAKIEGIVNISFTEIPFSLRFSRCVFNKDISVQYSKIKFLDLDGSHTSLIWADRIKVEGDVFLRDGFKAEGRVSFIGAEIGGDFGCNKGEFVNENGIAILADGIDVKGNVYLIDDFKAKGIVSFMGATIDGAFNCKKGEFVNKDGWAILADGISVKRCVFLSDGFKAEGRVSFIGATIDGDFSCNEGEFVNENGMAILADGMGVKGSVYLCDGFKAKGEVRFLKAVIDGYFNCTKGEFINENGRAIIADKIVVKGMVSLCDGFKAKGKVCFPRAEIDGDFDCEGGEFINEKGVAILADGMDVKGNACLRNGFKAEGDVSFVGAIVDGLFIWADVNLTEKTVLDLRNAYVGVLWDDEKSWPERGNLFLDGFVYDDICDYAPKDSKGRIDWLDRQGEEKFRPGPYEQLAKVLNKMGHSEDAKKILIEKEKKITKLSNFGWWRRFWRGVVLRFTIGYGYRPWQALWFIGAFILIGFIVFGNGYKAGVIVPAEKDAYISGQGGQLRDGYPKFNTFVYSIDMFVPVLDLHMKKYWRPDANKLGMLRFKKWSFHIRGDFIRGYMWVHICFGWILTTLWVVGLTGLVKK
jgi:sRNA-binding regulator protein Hfq